MPLSALQIYDACVAPYNATPNNTAVDNTPRIQDAIDDAQAAGGGTVVISQPGKYSFLSDHPSGLGTLQVPAGVALRGLATGLGHLGTIDAPAVNLLVTRASTQFIRVAPPALISDFSFSYPTQDANDPTPTLYPATILETQNLAGGLVLERLRMSTATTGIKLGGLSATATNKPTTGRFYLRDLEIHALSVGIAVDHCTDVGFIDNFIFQGPGTYGW